MNFEEEARDIDFDFPILADETIERLSNQHARAQNDYEVWKCDLLEWLYFEGKDPDRLRGYSEETLRNSNYKIDQIMRWLWNQHEYTTELTEEDADELMKELGRYSEYTDANLNNFVKTIKRIFAYYNHEKGKHIEWECNIDLNEPSVTNRDYFKKEEFRPLYEAALAHGTVKHYHSCSPEERDELKAHLAQRLEKSKEDVGPEDFGQANSMKIPSLVSVSLDCGLRPIEVGRAKTSWVNFKDSTLDIPKEESSKNEDNWKCVLSNKSVRALRRWSDERSRYEKYDGRNELWLNEKGNAYGSSSLNYLLNQLIDAAGIQPAGRDLSFYSIRHGCATVWADEENIHDAQEQLRHKKVETTLGYAHSGTESRHNKINSKW
ncbi:site-specific integrase [Halobacterium salinarum]|uniref:Phage integrase family protein n=1 Tax=Halobacterium salinarum (strain ATCC 33171 / DSM 3754 / JCM 8978 / NBRC 102687 / NCIMB 764 / 91-R6) TaxID=2597657 RepID=A0A4D6GUJ9_HALS9|nr:site-specific integrase [Halobacterium salinarum]MDL0138755.1 site-specific integrase [Halobacterium salinarum]QCC45405.1 XerC/D-like integrase [Halobacterium salinarum]TYO81670.1 Phage integrase family protein [Halobacterium salinarum DSM 3754]